LWAFLLLALPFFFFFLISGAHFFPCPRAHPHQQGTKKRLHFFPFPAPSFCECDKHAEVPPPNPHRCGPPCFFSHFFAAGSTRPLFFFFLGRFLSWYWGEHFMFPPPPFCLGSQGPPIYGCFSNQKTTQTKTNTLRSVALDERQRLGNLPSWVGHDFFPPFSPRSDPPPFFPQGGGGLVKFVLERFQKTWGAFCSFLHQSFGVLVYRTPFPHTHQVHSGVKTPLSRAGVAPPSFPNPSVGGFFFSPWVGGSVNFFLVPPPP